MAPLITRDATVSDYPAYVRLFHELKIPDPDPTPEHFAGQILPRVIVACEADAVIGYASWRTYGPTAHVMNVVVDPAARCRGIGGVLMDGVRARSIASGCTRWYLNVKRDNLAALQLYARCGLVHELDSWSLQIAWARVPPPGGATAADTAQAADAAAVAARFAVDRDRFEFMRGRPGYVLVALREAGELVGFAAFAPDFPGAYPFCATRPELGGALLDAMRSHADHTRFDFVRATIEGDPALKDALVALGAEVTLEILRLSAPLEA
jgi:GNAT superfamily N-acetyltransferase